MSCRKQYSFSPQVTPLAGGHPPSTTAPTYSHRAYITLTYPYTSPTLTIKLRNPAFGDTSVTTVESVKNVTLGNVPKFYRDSIWPVVEILNYQLEANYDVRTPDLATYLYSSLQEFLIFIKASLGDEIGLLDHEGVQWRGFILNPDAQSMRTQVNNTTINISFRGTRV